MTTNLPPATPAENLEAPAAAAAGDLSLKQQLSLLAGSGFWHTTAIASADVPAVLIADGPHGLRVQRGAGDHLGLNTSVPATCFPPAATLASSWDEGLIREVGEAVGKEARALAVGVVLGPGLNIKRHPLCGRNFEYYSEDPLLSGRFAAAAVTGIQSTGVGACVKHFAVNNQETRRFVIDAIVDERTRRELYLRGFEHVIKTGRPRAVMAAYNKVNGTHCTDDPGLLTGVLRTEWGFDGLVISDWGAVADRVEAVTAGMDLEMPGIDRSQELAAAVTTGRLPADTVTASAQRVMDLARATPTQDGDLDALIDDHDALARRAAAASSVVLTNNGILPLDPTAHVAVIGAFAETPRYQGSGSSLVTPTRVSTLLDAFSDAGVATTYSPGYDPLHSSRDEHLIADAVAAAKDADAVVVMVGLPALHESEGLDRSTLALPAQHDALVEAVAAANPRTVVVLSNGAPVLMPWHQGVAAILECYLGGQASGGAAVDALLGRVEPAGRLAETFPADPTDVAADPYFPGGQRQVEYREGLAVGYRHTTTAGITPLFPFGHGLGYGTTIWTKPALSTDTLEQDAAVDVTVTVMNVGERATSDVVQIYRHDLTGVVPRPRRELIGFTKVHLAPGETRKVTITLGPDAFTFWNVLVGGWSTPTGQVDLEVGRSSERIEATLSLLVHGDTTAFDEDPHRALIAAGDIDFARQLRDSIPVEPPLRPFTRDSTVGDIGVTWIGRRFRSAMLRSRKLPPETLDDPVTMALLDRANDELPLRGIAQFGGGGRLWAVVDTIIALANRHPMAAIRALMQRS